MEELAQLNPVLARSAALDVKVPTRDDDGETKILNVDLVVTVFKDTLWLQVSDCDRLGTMVFGRREAAGAVDELESFAAAAPTGSVDVQVLIGRRDEEDPLPGLCTRRLLARLEPSLPKHNALVSFGVQFLRPSVLLEGGLRSDRAVLSAQKRVIDQFCDAVIMLLQEDNST